jgi:sister-chromatid-cohesion protein PDS5
LPSAHRAQSSFTATASPGYGIDLPQASLRILNQSSIPTLIKHLRKSNSLAADNALKLQTFVSKRQPELYKTHIGELVKGVADEKHPKVVEVALQV